jgi:D-alanyl-lipoteichoic acid acyltransferase DltB (MBOAT superfamily)
MFYPQLVAGPIERPQNLLHQFYEKHSFEYERVVEGLKLMLWGLFMKLVIADRLAIYVNAVYNNSDQHNGLTLALATVFFAFQIYCDFAGYSNIAIGAAKVMGFKLMTNFNRPYFSKSISEFWSRWHISLSTWFRDYLYISLGGNRVTIPRWYFNLLFVFVISGLWHGANWTFIAWGALNGFYLVFAILSEKIRKQINHFIYLDRLPRLNNLFQILITFILACFAWIFFRANSMQEAFGIVSQILIFNGPIYVGEWQHIVFGIAGIGFLLLIEIFREYTLHSTLPFVKNHWLKEQLAYSMLIILILTVGVFDGSQFIYFQF